MVRWLSSAVLMGFTIAWCSTSTACAAAESVLVQWEFNTKGDFQGWSFGGVAEPTVADGVLRGRTVGSDPILIGPTFEIPAGPAQRVEIRMKSAGTSHSQLFWTETLEGKYGGFSDTKANVFHTNPDGQYHVYRIYPFWQAAGKIIRLRFDPPSEGPFEIDWIRILDTPQQKPTSARTWRFTSGNQGWWNVQEMDRPSSSRGVIECKTQGSTAILGSPLLAIPAKEAFVACLRLAAERGESGRVFYATQKHIGWNSVSFPLRADGRMHTYNVELPELMNREDQLIFVGISPTDAKGATVRIASIDLAEQATGPAELECKYFGPQEGVNRVGRDAKVICWLANRGGVQAKGAKATLSVPAGVEIVGDARQTIEPVSFDFPASVSWTVRATSPGTVPVSVRVEAAQGEPVGATASIEFTPAPKVPKTGYIPEPQPVASRWDIGTYYFPGWPAMSKWQPILDYPGRKPVLGWYDEANPECADWQIKWAVEHGIKFFLVDWYWIQGNRQLEHWVGHAYQNARFRKYLKWAVMWANHNPPNTHSVEDWRKVTQYWIDHCFGMEEYYRIEGRPAVFIWAPSNVRNDLGGSSKAAELYAMSQKMARDAGYKGIYFAAMSSNENQSACRQLKDEGYEAFTRYHGFEIALERANSQRLPFADAVKTAPDVWQLADSHAAGLDYYPILDTGWSPEPWHGNTNVTLYGRTPELLGEMCRLGRRYAEEHGKKILILGPWNEWGEGSYIEPCTEFGFRALDRIRETFCEPGNWPPNLVPADLGRGPYDLPGVQRKTSWRFEKAGEFDGWECNVYIRAEVRGGALRGRTVGIDPIIYSPELRVDASRYRQLIVRMKCSADDYTQVFWGTPRFPQSEASCVHFTIRGDGQFHDYRVDLGKHPRWRGTVTSLRIDPVAGAGREFEIEAIRLE